MGTWTSTVPCVAFGARDCPEPAELMLFIQSQAFTKIDPKLLNTLVHIMDGSTVSHLYAEGSLFTFSLVLPSLLKFRQ